MVEGAAALRLRVDPKLLSTSTQNSAVSLADTPPSDSMMSPLASLAAVAASLHASVRNKESIKAEELKSLPTIVTPCTTEAQRGGANNDSIIEVRFVLQKSVTATAWGMTLSMIDNTCLIVGYVDRALVDRYTAFAGHEVPLLYQRPQASISNLRPGDVIRSINGRYIASFPSFVALTEFLKANFYLSMSVLRDTNLPLKIILNSLPEHSYWTAEEAYRLLKPQLQRLKPVIPQPHQPRVVSTEEQLFQIRKIQAQHSNKPTTMQAAPKPNVLLPFLFTNPLFRDDLGKPLPYDDDLEFNPEDGSRAKQFLVTVDVDRFQDWVSARKNIWRQRWKVHELEEVVEDVEDDSPTSIPNDFWSHQGFSSFEEWRVFRATEWKRQFSWNQRKRKRIEEEAEEIVHFPSPGDGEQNLHDWLRVRKNQWRILRRKHQRKLEQMLRDNKGLAVALPSQSSGTVEGIETILVAGSPSVRRQTSGDMLLIDSLLEEQERKRQANLKTFDLDFVFDAKLGAPDDVIALCLRNLHPSEHGKLLCISAKTSKAIMQRDEMWRQLCPSHWVLPRRPRKRWHDLYITKIRQEEDASRKRSDDLLSRIANVLFKGDHINKVEKLIADGERRFAFDVNYVSGVVCERNSCLNLSVINGRHKVVRWLMETKNTDIESSDRGGFTPLLNAAWGGNIKLVRFLMSKGCDRKKIGRGHYSKPLAAPDFEGHTAEGWAREKGHPEVADLIRVGL